MEDNSNNIRHIVVLVKDVPDTESLPLNHETAYVDLENNPSTMSGVDTFAVAAASLLGQSVTALTMGPESAVGALREAMTIGANNGVLISNPRWKGADALTTARVLSNAVQRLGPELVVMGRESTDARTGVLGGMIAEILDRPLMGAVDQVVAQGKTLSGRFRDESMIMRLGCSLPAVISVAEYGADLPEITAADLERAFTTEIERWEVDASLSSVMGNKLTLAKSESHTREARRINDLDVGAMHISERITTVLRGAR